MITVIILIILAAVTINMTLGENGIFTRAKLAAEQYREAQANEENEINDAYNLILGATTSRGDGTVTIDANTLQGILDRLAALENNNGGSVPTGTIIAYYKSTAPTGYVACDGTTYNLGDHPELKTLAKFLGAADDATTFTVPDLRGEFLRGTGTNSHTNQGSGANVGTHQDGTIIPHFQFGIGTVNGSTAYYQVQGRLDTWNMVQEPDWADNVRYYASTQGGLRMETNEFTSDLNGAYTARPTNTSVLYCIKY